MNEDRDYGFLLEIAFSLRHISKEFKKFVVETNDYERARALNSFIDSLEEAVKIKVERMLYATPKDQDSVLVNTVKALYTAAHWTPDRPVDGATLWANVRDAAGIEPGNSPAPLGKETLADSDISFEAELKTDQPRAAEKVLPLTRLRKAIAAAPTGGEAAQRELALATAIILERWYNRNW